MIMLKTKAVPLRYLFICLICIGLLPVAAIGAWSIKNAIDHRRQELERSMLDLSRALTSAVDAELESGIATLRALSYNPSLLDGNIKAFYQVAQEEVRARPDWRNIGLTDGSGKLLFKTAFPYGAEEARLVDPGSVDKVIADHEPAVGSISKGQRLAYAFPIRVPVVIDGEVRYVLTAAVAPERMLAIVKRQNVPESWVISIQDATGRRVARSLDQSNTVGTGISETLVRLMRAGGAEGTGITITTEGNEVVTTYAKVPRYGWTVAIGAPTSVLREALLRNISLYAIGLLGSLLLCMALSVIISRLIVKASRDLQERAMRLGRGRPLSEFSSPIAEIDRTGKALHAASMERMRIEQERESLLASLNVALKTAEEANRAKDDFLAVLGHELRNPLAPLVTTLDLLDLKGDLASLHERQIMRRQVSHMKRLVDDLLDVSRITQGKLQIIREPVNLRTAVERALESVQPAVAARGRALAVINDADAWVSGDETRLVQAIANILQNAMRFDKHGEISVRLEAGKHEARIVIRDHGEGMAPEVAAQVFQPFYQAPQPLARSSGGLGLGLAIARSIVELHGGTISAASEGPGKGSAFALVLPLARPQEAASPAAGADGTARYSARRILLVDDNADAATTMAELLTMAGHEVSVAHSGSAALEAFSRQMPDAAVLDIGLPDMNGMELARSIRERFPQWRGRLIALTGYGQEADRARCLAAGFEAHLTKPVDSTVLIAAME